MERLFDILALGELNIDLILNDIAGFPQIGKEILADSCTMALGSSTAIFAANAAALGSKVSFLGMIGKDDFGSFIERALKERGVDTSMLIKTSDFDSGITVCMNYGQDRANVTYAGAMEHMGYEQISKIDFSLTKHVHISSLFLQGQLKKDIIPIIKHIKQYGVTVSLDTQWDPSEQWDVDWNALLPLIDVFMPNAQELQSITGTQNVEDAIAAVQKMVKVLVVKNGMLGSIMLIGEGIRRQVPALLNSNPVDCIGAGDSYNAGFVSAFVKGESLEDCQDAGNLTGAISTTAAGGTGAFASPQKIAEAKALFIKN